MAVLKTVIRYTIKTYLIALNLRYNNCWNFADVAIPSWWFHQHCILEMHIQANKRQ